MGMSTSVLNKRSETVFEKVSKSNDIESIKKTMRKLELAIDNFTSSGSSFLDLSIASYLSSIYHDLTSRVRDLEEASESVWIIPT